MKQRLTKRHQFAGESHVKQWEVFHETEIRVQRLERIIEDLLFWKQGTLYYKEAKDEYVKDYCGVEQND